MGEPLEGHAQSLARAGQTAGLRSTPLTPTLSLKGRGGRERRAGRKPRRSRVASGGCAGNRAGAGPFPNPEPWTPNPAARRAAPRNPRPAGVAGAQRAALGARLGAARRAPAGAADRPAVAALGRLRRGGLVDAAAEAEAPPGPSDLSDRSDQSDSSEASEAEKPPGRVPPAHGPGRAAERPGVPGRAGRAAGSQADPGADAGQAAGLEKTNSNHRGHGGHRGQQRQDPSRERRREGQDNNGI